MSVTSLAIGPASIAARKPIPLQPGKAAIGIGTLDKLPAIIGALINAVRAGELDAQIKEAAAARGLMMAERRKKAV
jgi:hypothetical protein